MAKYGRVFFKTNVLAKEEKKKKKSRRFESDLSANNNKKISHEKPRGIIMLNRSIDWNVAVMPVTFRFAVV